MQQTRVHPRGLRDYELYSAFLRRYHLLSPLHLARTLDKTYQPRPHVKLISDTLTKVTPKDSQRILINTPPQVGKSTLATMWFTIWWLATHPQARIGICSHSTPLARRLGRAIRDTITTHAEKLNLKIQRGYSSVTEWELSTGGGVKSVGVGAGLTGYPLDVLILDDLHANREQASSPTWRDRVWDWYSSVAYTRLSPGAPIITIMTRWHPDDIAGRLLAQHPEQWQKIILPAIAGSNDPLGRTEGEPLSHPKIPTKNSTKRQKFWDEARHNVIPRDWHALYQCNPQPTEGALLTHQQLTAQLDLNPHATPTIRAVSIDPSGGGRDTAGIVAGYLADDKRVYITHDATMTGPVEKWAHTATKLAHDTDADRIIIEKNYGGDMTRMIIETAWKDHGYTRPIPRLVLSTARRGKKSTATNAKQSRAEPIAYQITQDKIRFTAKLLDLFDEWATWQPHQKDSPGRIDALTQLSTHLTPHSKTSVSLYTPGASFAQAMKPHI